MINLINP